MDATEVSRAENFHLALDLSGYWPYVRVELRSRIMGRMASASRTVAAGRSERLEARIPAEQKALIQRAAELQGRTLTDFVIASAHEAAVRAIDAIDTIRLNEAESRAFAESLLEPREPTERLRAAARRYVETFGR